MKTIKDMPEHSRPREKLREKSTSALGLLGYAFSPPKIQPVWRYMGMPCALGWISRQISRQLGGMPAMAIL